MVLFLKFLKKISKISKTRAKYENEAKGSDIIDSKCSVLTFMKNFLRMKK